jgi:predicted nucleotidyltransferase
MNPAGEPGLEKAKTIIMGAFPAAKIWIFGSRATGKNKPSSGLDLCVDTGEKISLDKMSKIRREIEKSDILYRVDIVDRQAVDKDYLRIIESTAKEIQNGTLKLGIGFFL